MIDFRLKTFFVLCRLLNYTKTAEILHITQPAVSQHIKFLEEKYQVKLFNYKGRDLSLTKEGELLYRFVAGIESSSQKIEEKLLAIQDSSININFGTTLTIGEYTMPHILSNLIQDYPNIHINMRVNNTKTLLEDLENGYIDFALLEGHFNKSKYNTIEFSKEEFIGVSSPLNSLAYRQVDFQEIFQENLMIREEGSGSREIFEQILYENNFTIDGFNRVYEIGSINVIKNLIEKNLGITFLYENAVGNELKEGSLSRLNIRDFHIRREYNLVFLKHNLNSKEYIDWFKYFHKLQEKPPIL